MHLLNSDHHHHGHRHHGEGELRQSAAEVVVLSAADSELTALKTAYERQKPPFSLRLANLLQLGEAEALEAYLASAASSAKLVVARVLGGYSYWGLGVSKFHDFCKTAGVPLALLSGDDDEDPLLAEHSTLEPSHRAALWQYLSQGGADNGDQFLRRAAAIIGYESEFAEPKPMPTAELYHPRYRRTGVTVGDIIRRNKNPKVAVLFYRAFVQSANTEAVDELVRALEKRRLAAVPIAVTSLKDRAAKQIIAEVFGKCPPRVIVNLTGFCSGGIEPKAKRAVPVLQAIFATDCESEWRNGNRGLSPRDIAMGVSLPELDGRIISRAVAFKSAPKRRDEKTQLSQRLTKPLADRINFVAEQVKGWVELAKTPKNRRKIAVVLANYPNRNGRIGNGVGLDSAASMVGLLKALGGEGYAVGNRPENSAALMARLLANPTNRPTADRKGGVAYKLADYRAAFAALPQSAQKLVSDKWGEPSADPFVNSAVGGGSFILPLVDYGNVLVGIQPARGYNIDPQKTFHDPNLPPPHGYLAFYFYLRRMDALIHLGKHGNAEWLPGKSVALSGECFPEIVGGATPNFYPFIVNDPGEGSQAKRRLSAVVIDHLTPPLRRAELYGRLRELEALTDEYHEAAATDPRRLELLRERIFSIAGADGLGKDCDLQDGDGVETKLAQIDDYLCTLKERQIRDGLHILGISPIGRRRQRLLLAIARANRGSAAGHRLGITTALAKDFNFDLDPLACELGEPWRQPRPSPLVAANAEGGDADAEGNAQGNAQGTPWRTNGDTVERLEILALKLITNGIPPELKGKLKRTASVLAWVNGDLAPRLDACGGNETANLQRGLDGEFVPPGPAGAPSRGRPEVLPTGRNFYSLDPRGLPTPAAWTLGWRSASRLTADYKAKHGGWPKRLGLSAWGTSNMRTGGDDISQAMALLGVRPDWDGDSKRVIGFEILPLETLGRPRVDVTLRISGFFRDAFPNLIALFDKAVRAVAALPEDSEQNPLANGGANGTNGRREPPLRVFGPKPGAYGAGLQALIDESGWRDKADLARAYLKWSDTAYTAADQEGRPAAAELKANLKGLDAVVHNQDNYEHDILDSDDYYQFLGGMTAAVNHLSGKEPAVYMNDHSVAHAPRIQTLQAELAKVVRARAVNPLWLAGVMRHGYRGAAEIAATVDYLFAFAATTESVRDHHFDLLFNAYAENDEVRNFMQNHNPDALTEMMAKFREAVKRGLWKPTRNTVFTRMDEIAPTE